jgi:RecB family endonuclease NucS
MGTYAEPASENETDELIEASEATFGLERDLQLALRSDIEQLEPGLQIIDGGKERMTEAGRIDITAQDAQNVIVVIELKTGTAAPEALTQLLAYMGAVGQQDQRSVRGMLIAGDFHSRVVFAARAVPNVQLRRYRFKFTFESVA